MKTAYITFHIHNYGIGFTKNILGAFFSGKLTLKDTSSTPLYQKDLELTFTNESRDKNQVFDKVYYLHVNQHTIDKITSTRRMKKTDCLNRINEDEDMKKCQNDWNQIFEYCQDGKLELENEVNFINTNLKTKASDLMSQYWRIIHYYDVEDQIKWLFEHANSKNIYNKNNIETVNLEEKYQLKDLHNHSQISFAIRSFLMDNSIIENFDRIILNISNVGYEVQVVWFVLAQANWFPEKVSFISTYDNKDQVKRFKDFSIKEVSKNIIQELGERLISNKETKSEKRILAEKELRMYINKGFSILILGNRGIGKTRLIEKCTEGQSINLRSISAAAFDDDEKLESELFGYEKGAYTGADRKTEGLFHQVNPNGILFIDELHAMSKRVQEKMMSALSTNENGEFIFKRVRGLKNETAKFTIIFATNKTIDELKYDYLLPDFFDRVVQYVVEIPPLKEAIEDREADWEATWSHQKFNNKRQCPKNKELIEWLKNIDLPGNWRDLQRIAIWYNAFLDFDNELKNHHKSKTALEFVKYQYERICVRENDMYRKNQFSRELTANGQVDEYRKELALWAKDFFGSYKKATDYFNSIGDSITEKTFYNWASCAKNKI
jgi:transcriptional regulator with AAA-type ATPase domain